MKQLFVAFLVIWGHQVLGNPWKNLGNTWREQQHSRFNSVSEQNIRGLTERTSSPVPSETTSSTVTSDTYSSFQDYDTTTPVITTETPTPIGCGGEYNSTNGVIRHPLSGGNYQNRENCAWIIRATEPFKITFVRFYTEQRYDYLRVRDGESNGSHILQNYTGNSVPSPIVISKNTAYLIFTSDGSIIRTGFKLRWEPTGPAENSSYPVPSETTSSTVTNVTTSSLVTSETTSSKIPTLTTSPFLAYDTSTPVTTTENILLTGCGGEYNSTRGVIRHPLSGRNYQNRENCVWIIRATEPFKITFVRFDTEQRYDYLRVRDGESNGSHILQNYTGNSIPSPIVISTNTAYLIFTSDGSVIRTGFELRWKPTGPAENSSSPVPSETTSPTVTTVTTSSLVTSETISSTIPTLTTSPILAYDTSTPVTTTENIVLTGCGGEYNSTRGVIRHPLSGGSYQNDENCTWIIRATESFNIIFARFNTEQCCDSLRIKVGEGNDSRTIANFNGNRVPSPVQINTNTAYLIFTSDRSVLGTGFELRWEPSGPSDNSSSPVSSATTSSTVLTVTTSAYLEYNTTTPLLTTENTTLTSCGGEYNSTSGVIRHPLGGGEYQNYENCTWLIRAADPFNIVFVSFNIEQNWDYLRVKIGEGNDSRIIENFTGTRVPNPVQISTNTAYLIFTSDRSVTKTGFELRWEPAAAGSTLPRVSTETTSTSLPSETTSPSVPIESTTQTSPTDTNEMPSCGGEYNSKSGIIRHPLVVGYYPKNENCTWIIRTEDPVIIRFVSFETEQSYDYLQVRDGTSMESHVIGQFSGNTLPKPVKTSTNTANLFFVSDNSVTRTGFVIYWESAEPGETTPAM